MRVMLTVLMACARLVGLAVVLSSCSFNDAPAIRVGGNVWPGYEPMLLAEQLGYYDSERIKVIGFPSAIEVIRAYRNGALDVAAVTADEALRIVANEPDVHRIVLIADYSNGADAIVAQPEFSTMRALRGKRIGAELNALGALMLARALSKNGMTLADIELVPLTLDQHEQMFTARQVDAVVTFEPRRTRLLAQGAHQVFSSSEIPHEVMDVIVVRKTVLQSRPEQVQVFVTGWLHALEFMNRNSDAATRYASVRFGVTTEQYAALLRGIEIIDAKENRRLFTGDELPASLKTISEVMLSHGLINAEPKLDALLDARFVTAARFAIDTVQ